MKKMGLMKSLLIAGFLWGSILIYQSTACNEAVCASVVSKCQLTQSCKCDLKNCSCCHECFTCLSYLYDECCSCVGKTFYEQLFFRPILGPHVFVGTYIRAALLIVTQMKIFWLP